jgi:hypothetical protein
MLSPGVNTISGLMPASGNILLVQLIPDKGQKVFKLQR